MTEAQTYQMYFELLETAFPLANIEWIDLRLNAAHFNVTPNQVAELFEFSHDQEVLLKNYKGPDNSLSNEV